MIFSFFSGAAQEPGAAGKGGNQIDTYPEFHPRGFYMNWGYVYETGSFPQGGYKANGVSFDFGGKIFNKANLSNKVQVGADISSTFQWCAVSSYVNSKSLYFNQQEAYFMPWLLTWVLKPDRPLCLTLKTGILYSLPHN